MQNNNKRGNLDFDKLRSQKNFLNEQTALDVLDEKKKAILERNEKIAKENQPLEKKSDHDIERDRILNQVNRLKHLEKTFPINKTKSLKDQRKDKKNELINKISNNETPDVIRSNTNLVTKEQPALNVIENDPTISDHEKVESASPKLSYALEGKTQAQKKKINKEKITNEEITSQLRTFNPRIKLAYAIAVSSLLILAGLLVFLKYFI